MDNRNPSIVFAYPSSDDPPCKLPNVNARYVKVEVSIEEVLSHSKSFGLNKPIILVKSGTKSTPNVGTWLIFDLSNGDGCNLPNPEYHVYAWACATKADAEKLIERNYVQYPTTKPEYYFQL